jgi:hypothetical protein
LLKIYKLPNHTVTIGVYILEIQPWISYTIDDGYVYIASFQPMGRFSDFSATGK